jgi:O-antigen/teichoic acid export membrane protein
MEDLRNKTIRAGFANVSGRAVKTLLRVISIMALARLLSPQDYGLVGEVTVFTGVLNMVSGFGLSAAAVQHDTMTEEKASGLFWINVLLGGSLTAIALALVPAIAAFYGEPQLRPIACVAAFGFLLNGAGVQHYALLHRQMRFSTSVLVDVMSMLATASIAIGMAVAGFGYWALVSMTISLPFATTLGLWLATGWIPGLPRRGTGLRSMIHFGGTMTLHGLVDFFAKSFGQVLLGRVWGAEILGIYGRANNLVALSTDNLNSTIGEVVFAALSRTRNEPERLRRYFIKGYSLVVSLTVPLAIVGALFADELTLVALGPKWADTAPVFRILTPSILAFAIANPLSWLMSSLGLVGRGLKMSLISAPLMIAGATIGLPYGARGVAFAYSTVTLLSALSFIAWAVHGTVIRVSDIFAALRPPFASSLAAAAVAYGAHLVCAPLLATLPRTAVDIGVFGLVYTGLLFSVTDQRSLYLKMLRATTAASTS